jgi:hypothetical protein
MQMAGIAMQGFPRMHHERRRAGRLHCLGEGVESFARLLLVDADAALDGDRNVDRRDHRGDAFRDQRGLAHEARPEATALHRVGRAPAVEIDLVVAEAGADPCSLGEPPGLGPAELQRDRMLLSVESDQALAPPERHRRPPSPSPCGAGRDA